MSRPARIEPEGAHRKLQSDDDDFRLVCAYEDDEKFEENRLEGAIPFSRFRQQLGSISKNLEIAFY